jgi:alpha-glucosidase
MQPNSETRIERDAYRKHVLLAILIAIPLLGWKQATFAAWQTLGAVTQMTASTNSMELSTQSGAHVRINFVSQDVLRIRMNPHGVFATDFSYALTHATPASIALNIDAQPSGELLIIRPAGADGLRVIVHKQPSLLIDITDADGKVIVTDDPARPMAFDLQNGAVETSKLRAATELYYGFGEKALPLSRHQQYMTMWNSDTPRYAPGLDPLYQDIPFFLALHDGKSYGVFFDNTWRSYFDMGKTDPARYSFGAGGGELNYYVFSGGVERSPATVLHDYSALTGRGELPPVWALGYQQSRYSYTPQARVEEVARTFRAKKIPADVIYLDIDYMQGFRVFTWSQRDFPAPEKMLRELHDEGFHAVTIVDPGVKRDDQYPVYRSGREQNVFTRDAAGEELHATVWPGPCAFPDFTDPQARQWWGGWYAKSLQQGVDGFWNDMNEPATFPAPDLNQPILAHDAGKTFPLDARHAGDGQPGDHARYHNVYGMQMARATFEGLRALQPQHRPLVLTRAGYAGVQRYAAVWTGDNVASWEHLALTIPMLTNLSISGVPFIGADVGGFVGSPSAELYARWLQAAALTPFLRTHAEIGSNDREPWSYGEEFERINRATIELRYRLLPYLYTLFAQNAASGAALLRPLWFAYPHDVKTYLLDDEYLLGRDLLIAPVLHPGENERRVYFPQGDAWRDWWSGQYYAGGNTAKIDAPIDRLPLFVRVGAIIPSQPVVQHTGEMVHTALTLNVALGADGTSEIYQDAGDGYAYRTGVSRTTKMILHGDTLRLQITAAQRFQRIGFVEFIGLDAAPARVSADGKTLHEVSFDATTRRLRITLPAASVTAVVVQR